MGIWGEAELFLGIWGANANTFREMRTLFAGRRGDQYIIFRDQGSTDPPLGGLSDKKVTRHLAPQDKSTVNICDSYFKYIGDMLEILETRPEVKV